MTRSAAASPADAWHDLLRPDVELTEPFWKELEGRMLEAGLTFGGRLNCPFLRPFFLTEPDLARVSHAAETIARLGERVTAAAVSSRPDLLDAVALTEADRELVSYDPRYGRASTSSRLDAFLLPDGLAFAEYNAEAPAGLGYTESLAEIFDTTPLMARFREQYTARFHRLADAILDALLASYQEWGGTASPPQVLITDFRGVPTWNEFLILQARFAARGVPTAVCDPRELEFDGSRLVAEGRPVDLVYRRVLLNDIVARPADCRPLVEAYRTGAVCVANTFRCKVAHKKAFFAVLTDERHAGLFSEDERAVIAATIPWTRVLADVETTVDGRRVGLLEHLRREREQFVIKPNDEFGGAGVTLGWEAGASEWDAAIQAALASDVSWVAQRRIPVRREVFPIVDTPFRVTMREMLVDFAPYLFRGRTSGFLTRLSATGLANVTSGGGQVPSFVVSPRTDQEAAR